MQISVSIDITKSLNHPHKWNKQTIKLILLNFSSQNIESNSTQISLPLLSSQCYSFIAQQICRLVLIYPEKTQIYAQFCYLLTQGIKNKIKQMFPDKQKINNPFKTAIIQEAQRTFNKLLQPCLKCFEDNGLLVDNVQQNSKNLLYHVKFVAKLIRVKILKRKVISHLLPQLIFTFLFYYYQFSKTKHYRFFRFQEYIKAIIIFLRPLCPKYWPNSQILKNDQQQISQPDEVMKKIKAQIISALQIKIEPKQSQLTFFAVTLSQLDFHQIFDTIDNYYLKVKNPSLSRQFRKMIQKIAKSIKLLKLDIAASLNFHNIKYIGFKIVGKSQKSSRK